MRLSVLYLDTGLSNSAVDIFKIRAKRGLECGMHVCKTQPPAVPFEVLAGHLLPGISPLKRHKISDKPIGLERILEVDHRTRMLCN